VEANLALKTTDRKIGVTPVLLALIVLFLPSSGFGSVIRLAITPPAIHAGEDLSFLEKGFVDMLAAASPSPENRKPSPLSPKTVPRISPQPWKRPRP
jgi:hypothetical protein